MYMYICIYVYIYTYIFASDVLLPQPMIRPFATAYDSDSDHWKVSIYV